MTSYIIYSSGNYLKLNLPFITDILIITLCKENKIRIKLQCRFSGPTSIKDNSIPSSSVLLCRVDMGRPGPVNRAQNLHVCVLA